MLKLSKLLFIGGLLVMLAAIPVFAQHEETTPAPDINRAPVKEVTRSVAEKLQKGEIDLGAPFSFEIELAADEAGNSKLAVIKAEGDEKLIESAKAAVNALNESGYLRYLSAVGGKSLKASVSQDSSALSAGVTAEVESEARAKNLKMLVEQSIKVALDRNGTSEFDKEILKGVMIEAVGNKLSFKIAISKSLIQEHIKALIVSKPASK